MKNRDRNAERVELESLDVAKVAETEMGLVNRYCPHSIPVHPKCPFKSKFRTVDGVESDRAQKDFDGEVTCPTKEVSQGGDSGVSGRACKFPPVTPNLNCQGTISKRSVGSKHKAEE